MPDTIVSRARDRLVRSAARKTLFCGIITDDKIDTSSRRGITLSGLLVDRKFQNNRGAFIECPLSGLFSRLSRTMHREPSHPDQFHRSFDFARVNCQERHI